MQYLSPAVILILGIAAALIFIRFARKLFLHWAILIILVVALFVAVPKTLEIFNNFITVLQAIVKK